MTAPRAQSDPGADRRHLRRELLQISATLTALAILLALAVGAAHIDLGRFSPVIAMTLSAIKAALIAAIFMRLVREPGIVRLFAAAGLFWLAILFTLTLADYRTRPERQEGTTDHAEAQQIPVNQKESDAPAAPEHQ